MMQSTKKITVDQLNQLHWNSFIRTAVVNRLEETPKSVNGQSVLWPWKWLCFKTVDQLLKRDLGDWDDPVHCEIGKTSKGHGKGRHRLHIDDEMSATH